MTLPLSVEDRELAKFRETTEGPAVATVLENPVGSPPINIVPSGLRIGFKITTMIVGDIETQLPNTAFTGRNAMSISNLDTVEVLYVGPTGLEASQNVGTSAGWEVQPGESINFDVTDAVPIYGIAASGKTIKIKIMEIA